jgi:hypothetical protein
LNTDFLCIRKNIHHISYSVLLEKHFVDLYNASTLVGVFLFIFCIWITKYHKNYLDRISCGKNQEPNQEVINCINVSVKTNLNGLLNEWFLSLLAITTSTYFTLAAKQWMQILVGKIQINISYFEAVDYNVIVIHDEHSPSD